MIKRPAVDFVSLFLFQEIKANKPKFYDCIEQVDLPDDLSPGIIDVNDGPDASRNIEPSLYRQYCFQMSHGLLHVRIYSAREVPMFELVTPWTELITRGTIVYFSVLVIMRIWGRKHFGELTAFDFILLLIMSEAVQNSLVDDDKSVVGGIIVVLTFVTWNAILNKISYRYPFFENLVAGKPKTIIKNGKIDFKVKKAEHISDQELEASLRLEGVDDIHDVKEATVETNGHISVIQKH